MKIFIFVSFFAVGFVCYALLYINFFDVFMFGWIDEAWMYVCMYVDIIHGNIAYLPLLSIVDRRKLQKAENPLQNIVDSVTAK